MFGYKLIKNEEIENLKLEIENQIENLKNDLDNDLDNVVDIVESQMNLIDNLLAKIDEHESIIANLTKQTKVKTDNNEDKPVKKVRRKSIKKNKKEE